MPYHYARHAIFLIILSASNFAFATGMLPESPIVIVDQGDGEAAINIKNSDPVPMLLITSLQGSPDGTDSLLTVTPPAARVESGQSQRVRFIMTSPEPLKTERFERVVFEGVPPQTKDNSEVRVTVRQNLPVIIRPAGLAKDLTPWKNLRWEVRGDTLRVSNDSPYVVRLNEAVQTLPDNTGWTLPQSYILPGQNLTATLMDSKKPGSARHVRIAPATTWGFAVKTYDAPLAQ